MTQKYITVDERELAGAANLAAKRRARVKVNKQLLGPRPGIRAVAGHSGRLEINQIKGLEIDLPLRRRLL